MMPDRLKHETDAVYIVPPAVISPGSCLQVADAPDAHIVAAIDDPRLFLNIRSHFLPGYHKPPAARRLRLTQTKQKTALRHARGRRAISYGEVRTNESLLVRRSILTTRSAFRTGLDTRLPRILSEIDAVIDFVCPPSFPAALRSGRRCLVNVL